MFDIFFPDKLAALVKREKGSLAGGFQYLIMASAISVFLKSMAILFLSVLATGFLVILNIPRTSLMAANMSFVLSIILVSALNIGLIFICLFVANLIFTSLLKGNPAFEQAFLYISMLWSAVIIADSIFGMIPCIGLILVIIIILYSTYILFLLLKEIYGFSSNAALAGLLVICIITIVNIIILEFVPYLIGYTMSPLLPLK